MKRFVWRLQRVLGIKSLEEKTKRAELLKLIEKLATRRGELLMRKRILNDIISDLAGKDRHKPILVAGKGQLGEQEFFLKCSATIDEQIKKLENKVSELESQQREKTAEVLRARRFKKGLERLRAEAKTEFINEQEKLEQKDLDEGATISFARKNINRRDHKEINNH